ncbi:MAG: hypothetical protein NTV94_01250, partial [Planctomycetota bacterium]|nr:hypothetical protein [Planctomycetota bacterium]
TAPPPTQGAASALQAAAVEFSGRFITSMADVYDRVYESATSPEAALMARRAKLQAAHGVLGAATNPNPVAGMMDIAVLVTLIHETSKDHWVAQLFGRESAAMMEEVLARHDEDVWKLIARHFSPEQVAELREVIATWRKENPDQRYVSGVRLAQFPQASRSTSLGGAIAQSIFSIIRLDPFAGLDPAIREVEESRALAERIFFYARNLPLIASWQAEVTVMQLMATPQARQVLENTDQISRSTTRFVEATDKFAAASSDTAATIEHFREQLPAQQATLIEQLNQLVAKQRAEAIKQAFDEIATQREAAINETSQQVALRSEALLKQAAEKVAGERDAAIRQLDATISTQQTLLSQAATRLSQDAIDHLYHRAMTVVLVAVAGGAALIVLHRLLRPRAA